MTGMLRQAPPARPRRKTSFTAIAKAAGVSIGTVSRLLRQDPSLRISPQRRQQVLEVCRQMGYQPTAGHGYASLKQTRQVTVMLGRNITPAHFQYDVAQSPCYIAIEEELATQGIGLHYRFYDTTQKHAAFEALIRSQEVDGLILTSGQCDDTIAQLLHDHHVVHVADDSTAERYGINTVSNHVQQGLRLAVEHLAALGHRRIGWIGGARVNRFAQTIGAMVEAGLEVNPAWHCFCERDWDKPIEDLRNVARIAMLDWLKTPTQATAFVCSNDHVAMGVLDALSQRGLQDRYAIVGYDNIEGSGRFQTDKPVLTTVDNPRAAIGKRIGRRLINQMIHGQMEIVCERIPARLIVRSSTGPCQE